MGPLLHKAQPGLYTATSKKLLPPYPNLPMDLSAHLAL